MSFLGNAEGEGEDGRRRLPKEPSGIAMMADKLVKRCEDDEIRDEWQLVARIVNRLFLVVYLAAVLFSIVGIFLVIPGLLIARPEPPLSNE